MKKISLSIPEPCHENWDKMTRSGKGRFCAACQKTVIDFSRMSDRELAEFFKKTSSSICGRFQPGQLDRDILPERKRIPWIKYFFQFGLPAFLVSMKASAQGGVMVTKDTTTQQLVPSKESPSKKKPGQKIETEHKRMKFDEPILSGAGTGTKETIEIQKAESPAFSVAQALEGRVGGLVICVNERPSRMERIKQKITRAIDTAFTKNIAFTSFFVYPNPVKNNSSLRISCKKIVPGTYSLSIINIQGEIIQTTELAIESKNDTFDYTLGSTTPGTYSLRLVNKRTGKSYSEKIIIQ